MIENSKIWIRNMPGIGKRIIKSAIGVLICYVIYLLRGKQGIVFYSQLAVLWCIRPYINTTLEMAKQRTIGTLIGAAYALGIILLYNRWLLLCPHYDIIYYILISLMIIPVLYTTVLLNKKNASYFSTVVFLSIVVVHIGDSNPVLFTLNRIIDTMIGIVVGILVNTIRIPRKKQTDVLFISGIDDTLINEEGRLSDFSKTELNRMLHDGANFTVSTMRTPASVIDALSGINWKLPLIVMDGAALYDMNRRRFLARSKMDTDVVKQLLGFYDSYNKNCFVNIVIDDMLVITYKSLKDKVEKDVYENLRKSVYRNIVRANLLKQGDVLYLMTIGKREEMEGIYAQLQKLPVYDELKIAFYDSKDYPGYSYIKIYHKSATKEHMITYLKKLVNPNRTITFGSIEGKYDIVIKNNDSNKVVKTLERVYEPYFWEK